MAQTDDANSPGPKPEPPFTLDEFAALHGVSRTVVRKWAARGQIPVKRIGGKTMRAGAVLVMTADRPPRLAPGSLAPEQRAAWSNGRRSKAKAKGETAD